MSWLTVPWEGRDRAGAKLRLREARRRDAARYLEHIHILVRETRFMLQGPEDPLPELTEQKDILSEYQRRPNSVCIVACRPGTPGRQTILGSITLVGGRTQRTGHAAELAMGVVKAGWGVGIGSMLLDAALTWARANPILQRVSLQVYADNDIARELYLKRGFEHEGVHRRYAHIVRDDYQDLVGMGIRVAP